jgi:hypothetical protein
VLIQNKPTVFNFLKTQITSTKSHSENDEKIIRDFGLANFLSEGNTHKDLKTYKNYGTNFKIGKIF